LGTRWSYIQTTDDSNEKEVLGFSEKEKKSEEEEKEKTRGVLLFSCIIWN